MTGYRVRADPGLGERLS